MASVLRFNSGNLNEFADFLPSLYGAVFLDGHNAWAVWQDPTESRWSLYVPPRYIRVSQIFDEKNIIAPCKRANKNEELVVEPHTHFYKGFGATDTLLQDSALRYSLNCISDSHLC